MQSALNLLIVTFVLTTMFSVGATLTVRDLGHALRDGPYLRRALLANLVLVPAVTYALVFLLNLDPALSTALFLLVTVPGAPAVIKFVSLAREDTARAIGLVVVLMFLGIAFQPIVLPWLIEGAVVSPWGIARTLLLNVLLPLLTGMLVRAYAIHAAAQLGPVTLKLSTLSGLLVLLGLPAVHYESLRAVISLQAAGGVVVCVAAAMLVGAALGGPTRSGRRVLLLTCAQGNQAAAFLVATQSFPDPQVTVALIIVTLISASAQVAVASRFAATAPARTS
jgi:predicted Na+-dependent transporter